MQTPLHRQATRSRSGRRKCHQTGSFADAIRPSEKVRESVRDRRRHRQYRNDSCLPRFASGEPCGIRSRRPFLGSTALRGDSSVLQFSAEDIVNSQAREIIFQSQSLHHASVNTQRNPRIATLYFGESSSRNAGALCYRVSRVFSPKPGQLQILAETFEQT